MPTSLLILEPPKTIKLKLQGILFISLNMIFMPFYLKIQLTSITPLTPVSWLGCSGSIYMRPSCRRLDAPLGAWEGAQVSRGRWVCGGRRTVTSPVPRKGQQ